MFEFSFVYLGFSGFFYSRNLSLLFNISVVTLCVCLTPFAGIIAVN